HEVVRSPAHADGDHPAHHSAARVAHRVDGLDLYSGERPAIGVGHLSAERDAARDGDHYSALSFAWIESERCAAPSGESLLRRVDLQIALRDDVAQNERSEEHTSELHSRFDLVCRL